MIPMNLWIYVGLAAAWIGSLAAVGLWQRADGANAVEVRWKAESLANERAYDTKLRELQTAARVKEQENAAHIADIGAEYAKEKLALDTRRRSAESDAIRLRVGGICASGGSASSQAGTSPARSDDPTSAELPREITKRLLDLADDADTVALQLSACQAVIRADRQ